MWQKRVFREYVRLTITKSRWEEIVGLIDTVSFNPRLEVLDNPARILHKQKSLKVLVKFKTERPLVEGGSINIRFKKHSVDNIEPHCESAI